MRAVHFLLHILNGWMIVHMGGKSCYHTESSGVVLTLLALVMVCEAIREAGHPGKCTMLLQ